MYKAVYSSDHCLDRLRLCSATFPMCLPLNYVGVYLQLHCANCLQCAGEQEIPGLTDTTIPRRLGPKRASKIRKLFNLKKEDDVRQYVVRRPLPAKEGLSCFIFSKHCLRSYFFQLVIRRYHPLSFPHSNCLCLVYVVIF